MLRELATMADVAPAQAHAYLVSFRKLELVEQDAASGRYQLGPFALQLGIARLRSFDPLRLAGQAIIDFSEEIGLMVTIAVWGTHGPTIVQVQEGSDQVHVNVRTGTVFSIAGTATGKVFAAFMPPKVVESQVTEELRKGARIQGVGTATSRKELEADIAKRPKPRLRSDREQARHRNQCHCGAGLRLQRPDAARHYRHRSHGRSRCRSRQRLHQGASGLHPSIVGAARPCPSYGRRDGPGRSCAGRKPRNSGKAPPSRLSFPTRST